MYLPVTGPHTFIFFLGVDITLFIISMISLVAAKQIININKTLSQIYFDINVDK